MTEEVFWEIRLTVTVVCLVEHKRGLLLYIELVICVNEYVEFIAMGAAELSRHNATSICPVASVMLMFVTGTCLPFTVTLAVVCSCERRKGI